MRWTAAIALTILMGCSTEENTTATDSFEVVDLASSLYEQTSLGVYNGVFTTLDGQQQGTVRVSIPNVNTNTIGFTASPYPRAEVILSSGVRFVARSSTPMNETTAIDHMAFVGNDFKFHFSVDADGSNPRVSDVQLNGQQSDIMVGKHSNRAPVIPIPGTFACTSCGTPAHPALDNSGTQTFNLLSFTDPDGNASFMTQSVLGSNAFSGTGTQSSCVPGAGNQTTCDIVNGGSGIPVGTTNVTWAGTHTFDNQASGMQDCSGVSGSWNWVTVNYGTISGTFTSTSMCPPPPSGPLVFEDFEDNTVTFTTPNGVAMDLFHDGSGDYFHIVPLNGGIGSGSGTINNIQDSNFFGANDIDDGNSRPNTQMIMWNGLDISGMSSIQMSAFFAEGDRLGSEAWDADTSMRVEYRVDGGGYTSLFAIEASEPGGDMTNRPPYVDLNFNGTGNDDGGAEITATLTQYTSAMTAVSGSTLDVRIVFAVFNSGDEDIAIDNFTITAN